MLPMGTIVTVCMFLGLLFANRLPVLGVFRLAPPWIKKIVGSIVLLAGAWNVFWHASRHLFEFWGVAALVSGILMMITGLFIINEKWLAPWIQKLLPAMLLLLLLVASYYAWTIYQL